MKTISRKPILLFAVVLLAVTTFVLVKRHRRASEGPVYDGRTLSEWVGFIDLSHYPDRTSPLFLQTSNAIVQIGTNGLPCLVEWIRYKPSPTQIAFWSAFDEVWQSLPSRPFDESIREWARRDFHRAKASQVVFQILGQAAAPCISNLSSIANDSDNLATARRATYALRAVGPAALTALLEIASNTNAPTRREAIYSLGKMGTNAVAAIPMLIQTLDGIDGDNARAAATALGRLALEPDLVIPTLTSALQRPEHLVRWVAADALAAYGTNAAPAVPALRLALADQHPYVREAVSNALQVITSRLAAETAEPMPR